ncbi:MULTISPECIES: ATP-binding protein [unclassified Nonomuraea]|uniref:ATP-binding protein n=1 Tax=unclassified Nonomuraea TaxID=2593643 RepID=UPI0033DE54FB
MVPKPDRVFARDAEWRHLARFAAGAGRRPQLGVISGRRRQGKTFLVEALARETNGFYFGATEATETESLRLFSTALTEHVQPATPYRFGDWNEAMRQLVALSAERREVMVIDEFPYLSKASPTLPSIIQREIDRAIAEDLPASLLLCGSAMSVMGRLLAGNAPLRGRASMELVIRPFDYRLAARYWGIEDFRLAVQAHAVVGGTPAYLRFVSDDTPRGPGDFDDWVRRTVLDPGIPLFREARYLLEEAADVRDSALYHSVLAAVATGNGTRGGIAAYIGRKAADVGHHLNVLEDSSLLRRDPDVFRSSRSVYRVSEPLITFYQVVMRPRWGLLESGRAEAVWKDSRTRFRDQVLGPHFEELCRAFARAEDVFGELPGDVGAGVVTDAGRREQIEVDVVVFAPAMPGEPRRILSLGEAKWGRTMGSGHSGRLRRARDVLGAKGYDVRDTVIACYSGTGFDAALRAEPDVRAIGLDELYG